MRSSSWLEVGSQAFMYYPRLGRVRVFCSGHFHEKISLQRAADIAGLERTYFSTYFRQKVVLCFNHWLTNIRINQAMHLLQSSSRSISSVAYEVGFNNLTTFERAFKRCTGVTATRYKSRSRPSSPPLVRLARN